MKTLFKFVPLSNFESAEVKSEYVTGLVYNVREGNEKLAELAHEWAANGLVELLSAEGKPTPGAKLAGKGEVI